MMALSDELLFKIFTDQDKKDFFSLALSRKENLERLVRRIKIKRNIPEMKLISLYWLGENEKFLFDGKEEEEVEFDLSQSLEDIFQNISAGQVIELGLFQETQGEQVVWVKSNDRKEDIVIGKENAFDVHPIDTKGANMALDKSGFQKRYWKLYLVKPELCSMDSEGKGIIVTHRIKVFCDPKPSMIIINTKEDKIVLEVPNQTDIEISLIGDEKEEGQCKQKIFYDKKNLPVWDRWGRDVAEIVGSSVVEIAAAGIGAI